MKFDCMGCKWQMLTRGRDGGEGGKWYRYSRCSKPCNTPPIFDNYDIEQLEAGNREFECGVREGK